MKFLWPSVFVALALIPLLILLYLWGQRRRRRFAVRFSSLSLVRAALPAQSRLRRYLPMALLFLALAIFQTTAVTDRYGLAVITGNLALVLVVGLVWGCEVIAERNDFAPRRHRWWKWWVAPVAAVALLAPVDASTMSPDFNLARLLSNEAGLTFCMMTPVVLAVLTLYHPTVNPTVLRVSSFVGILLGAVNMVVWFVVEPWGWWMGVLHLPLLSISIYGFVLGQLGAGETARLGTVPSGG